MEKKTSNELMLEILNASNIILKHQGKPLYDTSWLIAQIRKTYIDQILADLEKNENNKKRHGYSQYKNPKFQKLRQQLE